MSIRINGDNTTAAPGITSGADTDTGLQFGTDEIQLVTGGTNRATVESNGNFTIENGNLVVASGHGIDFSATGDGSGTMSSELLDDYEEGEWTPSWKASGTITTDSVARGFYTKIGDMCCVSVVVGSTGTPTGTDNILIEGLPYAPNEVQNVTKYQGSFEAIYFTVNSTTQYSLSLSTNSELVIRKMPSGGGNVPALWSDVQAFSSFEIRGTLWYKVA